MAVLPLLFGSIVLASWAFWALHAFQAFVPGILGFYHLSGIVGSSIALNLAKKGCKVTLLDASPHAASAASGESWAWLNANRKAPEHYRGMY